MPAKAAAQRTPRYQPSLAAEGLIGVGTPVGLAGAAVEVAPIPNVVLSNGVGWSLYGLQLASMLQVRSIETFAGRLGAGLSSGPYRAGDEYGCTGFSCSAGGGGKATLTRIWSRAVWVNLEASVEHYRPAGAGWRAFLGVGVLANSRDGTCRLTGFPTSGSDFGDPCPALKSMTHAVFHLGVALRFSWLL